MFAWWVGDWGECPYDWAWRAAGAAMEGGRARVVRASAPPGPRSAAAPQNSKVVLSAPFQHNNTQARAKLSELEAQLEAHRAATAAATAEVEGLDRQLGELKGRRARAGAGGAHC